MTLDFFAMVLLGYAILLTSLLTFCLPPLLLLVYDFSTLFIIPLSVIPLPLTPCSMSFISRYSREEVEETSLLHWLWGWKI